MEHTTKKALPVPSHRGINLPQARQTRRASKLMDLQMSMSIIVQVGD